MSLYEILKKRVLEETRKSLENYTENYLRPNTPVRTGALQRSWRVENLQVVTDKNYAIWLEKGTEKMAPRFFIRTSFTRWKNDIS